MIGSQMMGDKHHELAIVENSRTERREAKSDEDSESGEDEHDTLETFREELIPRPGFGHNRYATRKTAAQGMMDVALLLANASQLKSVVEVGPSHSYYVFLFTMIVLSICLQIVTGLMLLWVGARESKSKDEDDVNEHTNRLNNITIAMVFLITVVNIFITSFGIGDSAHPLKHATVPTVGHL
ncbi:ninjurin-1-like isoform X2 [Liolophura sinensis]|uniref:ninjurin-1-like isoform X2 n=1 Tax=Liolophura sinensis TaxID=3198878 RepID=UPI003157FA44